MPTITVSPGTLVLDLAHDSGTLVHRSVLPDFTATNSGSRIVSLTINSATARNAAGADLAITNRFKIVRPSAGPVFSGKLDADLHPLDLGNRLERNFLDALNGRWEITLRFTTPIGRGLIFVTL